MSRWAPFATPERVALLLSLAMIPAITALIVTITSPLGAPAASASPPVIATPSPPPSPSLQPSPSASSLTPQLRQLLAANAIVLDEATTLDGILAGNGSGAQLQAALRRVNVATGVALDLALASSAQTPGGRIASDMATAYTAIRQRISSGLSATVTDTAAYQATSRDVLAQLQGIRTLDARLRALGAG
jgi:hypothetical protein